MKRIIILASLVMTLVAPRICAADVVTTTFKHFGNDIRYTFAYWPAFVVLGGAIAAAELTQVDQRIADHYRNGGNLDKFDTFAGYAGDAYVIDSAAVLLFGISKLAHAEKPALTGEAMVEALVLTEASVAGFKLAFHRERPNGGHWGFPSAHAARCFAAASVLETMYGPAAGVPAFLAAAAIAFSRIDSNAHNVSDVVFGAAWGAAIGWGTAWFHQKRFENIAIYPTMNNGYGLEFAYRF